MSLSKQYAQRTFTTCIIGLLTAQIATAQTSAPEYTEFSCRRIGSNFNVRATDGGFTVSNATLTSTGTATDSYIFTEMGVFPVNGSLPGAFCDDHLAIELTNNVNLLEIREVGPGEEYLPEWTTLNTVTFSSSNVGIDTTRDGRAYTGSIVVDATAQGLTAGFIPSPFTPSIRSSVDGTWAATFGGSIREFDANANEWFERLSVADSIAVGIQADGDFAVLRETGVDLEEIALFERSPFGFWTEVEQVPLPFDLPTEELSTASVQLTDTHCVLNVRGRRYVVWSRNSSELEQMDSFVQPDLVGGTFYWVDARKDGSLWRFEGLPQNPIYPEWSLQADISELSIAGGKQTLEVQGLKTFKDFELLWLGSLSGTSPGIFYGGQPVALNFDGYTAYLLAFAGSSIIQNQVTLLDSNGAAVSSVCLPPLDASFVGVELNHVCLVFEPMNSGPTALDRYRTSLGPIALTLGSN